MSARTAEQIHASPRMEYLASSSSTLTLQATAIIVPYPHTSRISYAYASLMHPNRRPSPPVSHN